MDTMTQSAYAFFLANAGASYNPRTETLEQGRRRGAKALAKAERDGTSAGLTAVWGDDESADRDWMDTDEYTDDERGSAAFYWCTVYAADGVTALASLHGIHADTRDMQSFRRYQRVVRAELFLEALERAS